jgi:hypothetical protein
LLLTAVGCADVLGIEDAHHSDPEGSSLPDASDRSGGAESGGTSQKGGTDEDDGSQGATGPAGSGGGAGRASSPDDTPEDPEPELPPGDSDGGSTGSEISGGTTGSGGTGSNGSGGSDGAGSSGGSSAGTGGTPSSGGSAAGGTGGTSGGEEPPSLSCDSYCSIVLANCTGQFAQYRSKQECLSVCALLPPGGPLSLSDNSVSCRQAEATLASLAPDDHCANAGPAGNGKCGNTCDGYCSVVLSACKPSDSKHSLPNLAKCTELCLDRTDLGDYGVSATLGYDHGKTQQCLLSHATAATTSGTKECESAVGKSECEK